MYSESPPCCDADDVRAFRPAEEEEEDADLPPAAPLDPAAARPVAVSSRGVGLVWPSSAGSETAVRKTVSYWTCAFLTSLHDQLYVALGPGLVEHERQPGQELDEKNAFAKRTFLNRLPDSDLIPLQEHHPGL